MYWRKYDHAIPPSLIESEMLETHGNPVRLNNTMLIFRNNFSEVIEVITEAYATMDPLSWNPGEFDSYVQVECIRKQIKTGKEDGESFKNLKILMDCHGERKKIPQRGRGEVLDLLQNVKMDNLSDQVKRRSTKLGNKY